MVGLVDPNPVPSKQQPEKQGESLLSSALANPVQVLRPPQGKYSPKTDERCITWCSQTVRGRTEGQDPWCRSICIRRVFEHEVRQLTSHFSHDAAHHSRISAGKKDAAYTKYPLPPEGQPRAPSSDDEDSYPSPSSSSHLNSNSSASTRTPTSQHGTDTRYWEEGWYIWMTKNRWAAQEKIDLMMFDLEKQTAWQKSKEQDAAAWAAEDEERARVRMQAQARERTGVKVGEGSEHHHQQQAGMTQEEMAAERDDELFRQTYLNASEESFLFRVPTRIPIDAYAQATLAPTWKVLGIVRSSFESGAQQDLARRAWDVTLDGAPFRLVRNVFKTCIESFKGGSSGDQHS